MSIVFWKLHQFFLLLAIGFDPQESCLHNVNLHQIPPSYHPVVHEFEFFFWIQQFFVMHKSTRLCGIHCCFKAFFVVCQKLIGSIFVCYIKVFNQKSMCKGCCLGWTLFSCLKIICCNNWTLNNLFWCVSTFQFDFF